MTSMLWFVWVLYSLFVAFLLFGCCLLFWPMKVKPLPPLPSTGDPWKDAAQEWKRAADLWKRVG